MEELTLRFYLRIFSIFLFIFIYLFYIFFIKDIKLKNDIFIIDKNESYNQIINKNIKSHEFNLFFYKLFLRTLIYNNINIHYGHFKISKNNNFIHIINKIIRPSNYYEKLTIVEGWSKTDLNNLLKKNYIDYENLKYTEVIADTYYITKGKSFQELKNNLSITIQKLKEKYKDNPLLTIFTFDEIIIIGSLLEKEGLDYIDKKKIYSVIINRLNKKMKLQIDATVIYSLTEGIYNLNRNLNYNDLKVKHDFNTYYIYGLPPKPIAYVGLKTIELIFENYKSSYLFYFYSSLENTHVYSKNYKNHLRKLNEYRSKK